MFRVPATAQGLAALGDERFDKTGFVASWLQLAARIFLLGLKRGFPKIRGTLVGVPIIRSILFWGLYWGPPI